MEKPTIYICIEIKNREYDSQILLAARAVLRGYRVYLGTHAAIYALIRKKKIKEGIFLDKSTQPRSRVLWNRDRTEFYCVLDAELSPILSETTARETLPSRIYPGTQELIDRFLVVGPAMNKVAKEYFGESSMAVRMTGWPRIDIWSKYGDAIYKNEIAKIRDTFGDYILYASSFGNIRDPEFTKNLENADPVQQTELNSFESMQSQYRNFKKFVKLIKIWDSNKNLLPIVIRPHTSEIISVWKKSLGHLNNTHIVSHGDIAPWIFAATGLIHSGSTAAIQAFYANKPVFILKEVTNLNLVPISTSVSQYFLEESQPLTRFELLSAAKNPEFHPTLLDKYIFNPKNDATDKIIDVFDELMAVQSVRHPKLQLLFSQISFNSARRAFGLVRDEIYWKFGKTNINSQLHFVPGGLDRQRIRMIIEIDSAFKKINYRRMTLNLWEFDMHQ